MSMRALMLLGPTASGKTALALELARHLPVEIISVDSALVYRDMDIGTAKPTAEERSSAPHHLIDIRDPVQSYSAAEFATDAWRLIDEIEARGRLPLLVGGTMLYARTLLHPMDDLPGARPDIRARLDAEAAEHGWPYLHQRLATLDPITAQRLHATDAQRIQRALEIIEITGQPLSTLHAAGQKPKAHPDIRIVSLEPGDRSQLHARIAQRFAQMLEHGFIDEVKHLSLSSSRAVHHPVDLGTKLVEDRLDDRGIGTCRREDEPSCIEGGTSDGLGECLRATIDEVVRCSGIVALGEATR